MEIFLIILWGLVMFYTAVCIWVPEARANWQGSAGKIGTVGCVGLALMFWGPALIVAGVTVGLLPEAFYRAIYPALLSGFLVAAVGWLIDITTK